MFDAVRFGRLAAATWSENRRPWAWFFVVGIIVHVLLVLAIVPFEGGHQAAGFEGQAAIWFTGLYLTAPIFAARYFQSMSRRESALVTLMRPASAFEKWLLAVIVVAVLYPVAYCMAFQVAGFPSWVWARVVAGGELAENLARMQPSLQAEAKEQFAEAYRYFLPWRSRTEWRVVLPILLALQGFAVLGSLYFRSLPFIKTLVVAFGLLLLLILAGAVFDGDPGLFFGYWNGEARLAPWQAVVLPAAWIGVPALLWFAALVALREREVA